ncbi:hypothetical protein A4H97_04845 [Niastella yeongjuensis]|uniref:Outer membrane protein beta-barrel domain-containing protein n=1 Tax=Niastella yeongjuensis TaxID=354355 RepID=A0A1V9ELM9_9BACT|nr:hypothetical protein [Niastella yeongjuensis]OQP46854.1 hypothetical protein A4H97_04845 [Niastella yeongjuensis]SEN57269.1 hypothetical protein SAMN05660816_00992 [Niastella yeongjuensis]
MKQTALLAISCLLAATGFTQDSSITVSKNKYIQMDVGLGYLHTNMSSINASLKGAGFKPMKEDYGTLSVSFGYFVNRLLFRTDFSLVLPNHVDQRIGRNTEFKGYTIGAAIGYALVQKPKFRLYPYAGITAFNTKLQFNDISNVYDMNELLNTPRYNSSLQFSNATLDLGVQLEKIFTLTNNKWDCPQFNRYMTMGVRLGYNISPGVNKARINGHQPQDAPEYNYEGPYIKLIIGTGTKIRQMKWQ